MSRRNVILSVVGALILAAYFLWSSLAGRRFVCKVCVEFGGEKNCATASAGSEKGAQRAARTAACGPLVQGRLELMKCVEAPPVSSECRKL